MTRINPNNDINNINNIRGTRNMKENDLSLEAQTDKMISDLYKRAEREVPEYGSFKPVYEEIKNPEKDLTATEYRLKIYKPNGLEDEKVRFLEAVAYKTPGEYMMVEPFAAGDKKEILNALKDENLKKKLPEIFRDLSEELNDV